jgi:hypothetical protein
MVSDICNFYRQAGDIKVMARSIVVVAILHRPARRPRLNEGDFPREKNVGKPGKTRGNSWV